MKKLQFTQFFTCPTNEKFSLTKLHVLFFSLSLIASFGSALSHPPTDEEGLSSSFDVIGEVEKTISSNGNNQLVRYRGAGVSLFEEMHLVFSCTKAITKNSLWQRLISGNTHTKTYECSIDQLSFLSSTDKEERTWNDDDYRKMYSKLKKEYIITQQHQLNLKKQLSSGRKFL